MLLPPHFLFLVLLSFKSLLKEQCGIESFSLFNGCALNPQFFRNRRRASAALPSGRLVLDAVRASLATTSTARATPTNNNDIAANTISDEHIIPTQSRRNNTVRPSVTSINDEAAGNRIDTERIIPSAQPRRTVGVVTSSAQGRVGAVTSSTQGRGHDSPPAQTRRKGVCSYHKY